MSDDGVADFSRHLATLEAEAGVQLDADERQAIFETSQAGGFNADATVEAFNDLIYEDDDDEPLTRAEFEEHTQSLEADRNASVEEYEPEQSPAMQRLADDLDADIARLSKQHGRPLLQAEVEGFARQAFEQVNRTGGYDRDKAAEGIRGYSDMSRDEADTHMVARARELDPEPEPDEDRVYDITNDDPQDYIDYATLRIAGGMDAEDFRDVYADDTPEEAA